MKELSQKEYAKMAERPLLLPPPEKTVCLRFVPAGESAFWASSCAISISSRE